MYIWNQTHPRRLAVTDSAGRLVDLAGGDDAFRTNSIGVGEINNEQVAFVGADGVRLLDQNQWDPLV